MLEAGLVEEFYKLLVTNTLTVYVIELFDKFQIAKESSVCEHAVVFLGWLVGFELIEGEEH